MIAQGLNRRGVENLLVSFDGQVNRKLSDNRFASAGWRGHENSAAGRQGVAGLYLKVIEPKGDAVKKALKRARLLGRLRLGKAFGRAQLLH